MQTTTFPKAFLMTKWSSKNKEKLREVSLEGYAVCTRNLSGYYEYSLKDLSSLHIRWLKGCVHIWFWNADSHVKLNINNYYVRLSVLWYDYLCLHIYHMCRDIHYLIFSVDTEQNKIRNPRDKKNQLRSYLKYRKKRIVPPWLTKSIRIYAMCI
jgi:hypothetical protein